MPPKQGKIPPPGPLFPKPTAHAAGSGSRTVLPPPPRRLLICPMLIDLFFVGRVQTKMSWCSLLTSQYSR